MSSSVIVTSTDGKFKQIKDNLLWTNYKGIIYWKVYLPMNEPKTKLKCN